MVDTESQNSLFLVSSCLVGHASRYDGKTKKNDECLSFLQGKRWQAVCPEQLGGLPTPRTAADLVGGDGGAVLDGKARVITREAVDVTAQFVAGAGAVLAIARQQGVCGVCLKAGSPSCGVNALLGVTAALLARHGIRLCEF